MKTTNKINLISSVIFLLKLSGVNSESTSIGSSSFKNDNTNYNIIQSIQSFNSELTTPSISTSTFETINSSFNNNNNNLTNYDYNEIEINQTTTDKIPNINDKREINSKISFEHDLYVKNLNNPVSKKTNDFQLITIMFDQHLWNFYEFHKFISKNCALDMKIYLDALKSDEEWAIKASDSSGRYRGQLYFGNNMWTGSQHFCYEVNNDEYYLNKSQQARIPMGYYSIKISLKMNHKLKENHPLILGQCLPKSCDVIDVKYILKADPAVYSFSQKEFYNESQALVKNDITILRVRSVPGDYHVYKDRTFYVAIIFAGIVIIFVLLGTICESIRRRRTTQIVHNNFTNNLKSNVAQSVMNEIKASSHDSKLNETQRNNKKIQEDENETVQASITSSAATIIVSRDDTGSHLQSVTHENVNLPRVKIGLFQEIISCFDLSANAATILSIEKLPEDSVTCLHGLRLFSLLWVIMVHAYLQLFSVAENKFTRVMTERIFWFQIFGNATVAVDTFFYISGLLVTLVFLRKNTTENRDNLKKFFNNSIIQTIKLILYRFLRLTPAMFFVMAFNEVVHKYTYNQSIFPSSLQDHRVCPNFWWRNMLYIQNWYPFSELCMIWSWYLANDMQFYIFAIIVLIISTRFRKTSVGIVILCLLSSWITTAVISISYKYIYRLADPLDSFGFLYDRAWTRIGPYIVGMMTGYIIYRFKQPPKISTFVNLSLWLLSFVMMFFIIFGVWQGSLSLEYTAMYISLSHTGWAIALIWITLSCKWGYAKPIDAFLSYPAFLPLSRLTYCAYLIHPTTQTFTIFNMDGTIHITVLIAFTVFLGNAVVSFCSAFLISLAFESPMVRLLKLFFGK